MRLQSKMIAVVGVIVLITILTWVVVAQALFMGNYQQLERNDVQSALGATRYSLELSASEMNQTARDYASWDDTYNFVVTNNSSYITDNLVESTFQNLRLNLLFIENTDGKIVVAKAYDLVNGSFVALPGELDRLASTDSPLFFHNESTGTSTGIVSTANGSLLVASQPILTSERAGPIHGTLVFGRYLTPDVLTTVAGPGKAVSAYPFGAQSLEQVQRVQPALAEGASSVIEPVNATTVAGFTLLRDIYGNPSLVIEEVLPRTIYEAGLSSTNTFLGLLVISGVISLTCMIWSLRQSVLAPLLRINTSLARIRTSDDLSKRVPERGDVELVWLAHAINATLASLESSHAERDAAAVELLESEEMLRLVLNASEDAISLVDTNEVFLTANEALAHRLGVPAAEVIGTKGFTEKPEDIATQRRAHFARAIATKLPVHFDDEHAGRQLENVYQPLFDARGNVTKVAVFSRDITERKRAEAALISGERRIREITNTLPVVVYEADTTGCITFVNATAFDLFGYTKEEIEAELSIFQLITPADRKRARAVFRRRMNGEDVGRVDYTGLRKDKSTLPISIRAVAMMLDGAVIGQRGVILDVTELSAAQEALRKDATMFNAAHDAIMTLDPEGKITYWNRGAERLYGWTTQEAEGQNANALLRTKFPESREALWPKLMESGLWEGELIHVTRDGVPVTVASSWTLMQDEEGNPSAILEISSDITEGKKAELARAESEAKLRITFATMADGIVIAQLNETVTDCNEAILRLTQRSREEIIGKPFDDLLPPEFHSLIPDARKLLVGAVFLRTEPGNEKKETVRTDSQLLRKNGERVDIETNISLIEDASGQPAAFLIVARDVTERKKMEHQLDSILADLQRSNAELEQFAYVTSHDLQEPLRMITSYIQLIEEDYKGKLDADADQYIAFAVEGAKRMHTLINDLLAYSRVGTRGEPFLPTSMSSALSAAIANLDVAIEENHAVITHDELPTVFGDEAQLIQLFQNLLGNAIKFRGEGTPMIHVGVEETNDDWVFSVRDNGIGIDMKHAERIFVVFQRLHAREEYAGTGIGLAVVKKIVERHGGHIWVESEPANGSTFYFTLPKEGIMA